MYILGTDKQQIKLTRLETEIVADRALRTFAVATTTKRLLDSVEAPSLIARACRTFFDIGQKTGKAGLAKEPQGPPPTAFRDTESGLLHVVYRELVVRFQPGMPDKTRRALLQRHKLEVRRHNPFISDQVIVYDPARKHTGEQLVEASVRLAETEEVIFASPNFVSQFRREAVPKIKTEEWHLDNNGAGGAKKGEDVDAQEAWQITTGKRAIVVAVLDDGVDIDHPNLKPRLWRNPDKHALDKHGRDYFLPPDDPGFNNPRPKIFHSPFDETQLNDIHGTCCAGVACAGGAPSGSHGIAPSCRLLSLKIFHGEELAPVEAIADAIRFAALNADILSCSWTGPQAPDIIEALADAARLGRGGKGAPAFFAAGNENHAPVGFPARHRHAIAVGASTDQAELASYSNVGKQIAFVAPSNGGVRGIFTTDVSLPNRGYNLGEADAGGKDGLYTNDFGGTSSATPLAAGIAALMLSVNPELNRTDLRDIMQETADRIGDPADYDSKGHSDRFGHGRVNAAKAVESARGLAKTAKAAAQAGGAKKAAKATKGAKKR